MKTEKNGNAMRVLLAAGIMLTAAVLSGCEGGDDASVSYPAFKDVDGDSINDFVEPDDHESSPADPNYHEYVDNNGNGICDEAEGENPSWHGPGYTDEDGNGECDYWQRGSRHYRSGHRDIVWGSDFDDDMDEHGRH